MKGSIIKRAEDSYSIVVTLGKKENGKPNQKWITVKGTKKYAEEQLTEILHQYNTGQYIDNTKMTVDQWLKEYLDVYVTKSTQIKERTIETYTSIIEKHLIPAFRGVPLQKLTDTKIQKYYNGSSLSPTTLAQHHVILYKVLNRAVRSTLILSNPCITVESKPKPIQNINLNIWNIDEIKKFLFVAKRESVQAYCFYLMLLECGLRKGEVAGLEWQNVFPNENRIAITKTLLRPGTIPKFGTPKNNKGRNITMSNQLTEVLKKHRIEQNKEKLAATDYHDFGLVFAKQTGFPLQINNLGQREFAKLTKEAGIKTIRFHNLRHSSATLQLSQGINPKVVSEKLGHSKVDITLDIYSHVLPTLQKESAQILGTILES